MTGKNILVAVTPATLEGVCDRLQQLSDAMLHKRETVGLTPTEQRDWSLMLDYWYHVEYLLGLKERSDEPDHDPLALLKVAEKFNLAAPDQIVHLRNDFMKKAARIIGHDVTPAQVGKLFKLFKDFNPAQP